MKRKCCHNAWLEQLWQNCFFLSVCCAMILRCLFLERKRFILLNVIAWEMAAFLFVKGHGSRWEGKGWRHSERFEVNLPNATNWHVQKHLLMSHSFCLTYIHSLCGQNTIACFLFNRTKSGGGQVKGRKKKRKECHRPQWLYCWCCRDASSSSCALSSRCSVVVYSYISKQGQIFTRPMPKGPLENLSEWIAFCGERKKY